MKFDLPKRLLLFWYPVSLIAFLRVWRNLLILIEEDLAVGLMWRLIFTPLFHDTSVVGRILSFLFRSSRILLGLVTYFLATIMILAVAVVWFAAPVVIFFSTSNFSLVLLFGVALFIYKSINEPPKKIWQIKDFKDLWQATKLKKTDLAWEKLLQDGEVRDLLTSLEVGSEKLNFRGEFNEEVYEEAVQLAKEAEAYFLTPAYFWVGSLKRVPNIDNELLKLDLALEDFRGALKFLENKRNKWRKVFIWDEDFDIKHLKGINRGWLGVPTPNLDRISTDLTKQATRQSFDDFIGRSQTVNEVIKILSQDKDSNVLLVGEPGSGKSTLVKHLAKLIVVGNAPQALATKRLVELDLARLLSNSEDESNLAGAVKAAFDETRDGEIIMFIDEIQNFAQAYQLILPYLESSQFQFIATTENSSYSKVLERNPTLVRIFHKVNLEAASSQDSIQILQEKAIDLARLKKILVTYLAIKEIVNLSKKLIHDRVLPDSALFFLEEAKVFAQKGLITTSVIREVFARNINVPVANLGEAQKDLLLGLEEIIHQRLIDQEEAVRVVANTLRRGATALREASRPIGSFLFVGPTGVGKTELAKTLADVYFKNSKAYLRFDMSEYQTDQAVDRLIGTIDNPGELTEAVKNKPYGLLLLDEFEKANPKILTLFLQVLEDGRLTDGSGKLVDFTNTIIIATSNVAALTIADGLKKGISLSLIETQVKGELLKIFKPELINRFDSVVIFKPLSKDNLTKIVNLKLKNLEDQLKEQGYLIEFNSQVVEALASRGFDPVFGARPLRRLIQDTLEANLSKMILEGRLDKGEVFKVGVELMS